jgi:hypothetical protein
MKRLGYPLPVIPIRSLNPRPFSTRPQHSKSLRTPIHKPHRHPLPPPPPPNQTSDSDHKSLPSPEPLSDALRAIKLRIDALTKAIESNPIRIGYRSPTSLSKALQNLKHWNLRRRKISEDKGGGIIKRNWRKLGALGKLGVVLTLLLSIPIQLDLLEWVLKNAFPQLHYLYLSITRSLTLTKSVIMAIIDYKILFFLVDPPSSPWFPIARPNKKDRHDLFSNTHRRCARRIMLSLKKNGGVFVKMGQHLASVQVLPDEWREEMKELQVSFVPCKWSKIRHSLPLNRRLLPSRNKTPSLTHQQIIAGPMSAHSHRANRVPIPFRRRRSTFLTLLRLFTHAHWSRFTCSGSQSD